MQGENLRVAWRYGDRNGQLLRGSIGDSVSYRQRQVERIRIEVVQSHDGIKGCILGQPQSRIGRCDGETRRPQRKDLRGIQRFDAVEVDFSGEAAVVEEHAVCLKSVGSALVGELDTASGGIVQAELAQRATQFQLIGLAGLELNLV